MKYFCKKLGMSKKFITLLIVCSLIIGSLVPAKVASALNPFDVMDVANFGTVATLKAGEKAIIHIRGIFSTLTFISKGPVLGKYAVYRDDVYEQYGYETFNLEAEFEVPLSGYDIYEGETSLYGGDVVVAEVYGGELTINYGCIYNNPPLAEIESASKKIDYFVKTNFYPEEKITLKAGDEGVYQITDSFPGYYYAPDTSIYAYESSDDSIIEINDEGQFVAKKVGDATLSIRYYFGETEEEKFESKALLDVTVEHSDNYNKLFEEIDKANQFLSGIPFSDSRTLLMTAIENAENLLSDDISLETCDEVISKLKESIETSKSEKYFSVNGIEYSSLLEAAEVASGTGEIKLLKDISMDISIPYGMDVTIDLSEHKITGSGNNSVINNSGNLTLRNGEITMPEDADYFGNGGGIKTSGELHLNNALITNCVAKSGGAIYFTSTGKGTIENCTFTHNSANNAGAIYIYGGSGKVTISNSTFESNTASATSSTTFQSIYATKIEDKDEDGNIIRQVFADLELDGINIEDKGVPQVGIREGCSLAIGGNNNIDSLTKYKDVLIDIKDNLAGMISLTVINSEYLPGTQILKGNTVGAGEYFTVNTGELTIDDDGILSGELSNVVEVNGVGYPSFDLGLKASQEFETATIKLLTHATQENPANEDNIFNDLIIDLNGYTLDASHQRSALQVAPEATVTIKDSSIEQTGVIKNTSASNSGAVGTIQGVLNIEGGTIIGQTTGSNGGAFRVWKGGTINMSGGIIQDSQAQKGGAIYIGGTGNTATLNITGGEIKDCVTTDISTGDIFCVTTGTTLCISEEAKIAASIVSDTSTSPAIEITGGYFDRDVSQWISNDYKIVDCECGIYCKKVVFDDQCGHISTELINVKDVTCTEDGYTGDIICTSCGETIELGDVITKLGHDYKTTVIEPTPDAQGYTLRKCRRCEDSYKDNYTTYTSEEMTGIGKVKVEKLQSFRGDEVEVKISIENNPGIASATLNVSYDSSALELISVTDGGILGVAYHTSDYRLNPYLLTWANDTVDTDFTTDGTIATLKFKVKDGAEIGNYEINVFYDYDNWDVYNCNIEPVDLTMVNGGIEVIDYIIGDVNDDKAVNNLDRLVLTRYLAHWEDYPESVVNMLAADVNQDGNVNNLDRLILTRYLAHWEGYESLPYV